MTYATRNSLGHADGLANDFVNGIVLSMSTIIVNLSHYANGHANGHVNNYANNDFSSNGYVSDVNSHTNGHADGYVNGLTNRCANGNSSLNVSDANDYVGCENV